MLNPILPDVSNRADWTTQCLLRDAETGDPVDLSGHTIVVQATPAGYAYGPTLTASSDAGDGSLIFLDTGVFQVRFTAAQLRTCAPVNYNIGAIISFEGETEQLAIGVVNLVDGMVP